MTTEEIRLIGMALSPILILLFAFEMTNLDDVYGHGLATEKQMSCRVIWYVLKLPGTLLLPLAFAWYGLAALAALDAASIATIVREQKLIRNIQKEDNAI